jgi:hypothetical protein
MQPLPPEVTPLLAIVNSRSGGRQGKGLFKKLKTALCRGQVRHNNPFHVLGMMYHRQVAWAWYLMLCLCCGVV